jgi:hypothetical protein
MPSNAENLLERARAQLRQMRQERDSAIESRDRFAVNMRSAEENLRIVTEELLAQLASAQDTIDSMTRELAYQEPTDDAVTLVGDELAQYRRWRDAPLNIHTSAFLRSGSILDMDDRRFVVQSVESRLFGYNNETTELTVVMTESYGASRDRDNWISDRVNRGGEYDRWGRPVNRPTAEEMARREQNMRQFQRNMQAAEARRLESMEGPTFEPRHEETTEERTIRLIRDANQRR